MGLHFPSSSCCDNMAAMAKSDASVSIQNGLPGFGIINVHSEVISFFNCLNALCCNSVQCHSFFPVSFVRGFAIFANPFTNLR